MKIKNCKLFLLLALLPAWEAGAVSIEEFKKISSPDERNLLIQQAPPEQREELKKIHLHLALLEIYGDETRLRKVKESYVASARGLSAMEGIFQTQLTLWEYYIGSIYEKSEKTGQPLNKRVEEDLSAAQMVLTKRIPLVHTLVAEIAASPAALKLEEKIEKMDTSLIETYGLNGWDGVGPMKPFPTKAQVKEVDKQIGQIFEEMKKLPKLTPLEVQKEVDQFPESEMHLKRN